MAHEVFVFGLVAESVGGVGFGSSSARMRIEGVQVSANCPDFAAQTKHARNVTAMPRLARMRISRTVMG